MSPIPHSLKACIALQAEKKAYFKKMALYTLIFYLLGGVIVSIFSNEGIPIWVIFGFCVFMWIFTLFLATSLGYWQWRIWSKRREHYLSMPPLSILREQGLLAKHLMYQNLKGQLTEETRSFKVDGYTVWLKGGSNIPFSSFGNIVFAIAGENIAFPAIKTLKAFSHAVNDITLVPSYDSEIEVNFSLKKYREMTSDELIEKLKLCTQAMRSFNIDPSPNSKLDNI